MTDTDPLEELVFTVVRDTEGRLHLLHGHPAVGQRLSENGGPLCCHAALSLDNGGLVHLSTTANFDSVPFSEAEKLAIATLVEGYCFLLFEEVPRLERTLKK